MKAQRNIYEHSREAHETKVTSEPKETHRQKATKSEIKRDMGEPRQGDMSGKGEKYCRREREREREREKQMRGGYDGGREEGGGREGGRE